MSAKPCRGGWYSFGSERDQAEMLFAPCTCRSFVACIDCGEPHRFVARCPVCAAAGRSGVPWAELARLPS